MSSVWQMLHLSFSGQFALLSAVGLVLIEVAVVVVLVLVTEAAVLVNRINCPISSIVSLSTGDPSPAYQ